MKNFLYETLNWPYFKKKVTVKLFQELAFLNLLDKRSRKNIIWEMHLALSLNKLPKCRVDAKYPEILYKFTQDAL